MKKRLSDILPWIKSHTIAAPL